MTTLTTDTPTDTPPPPPPKARRKPRSTPPPPPAVGTPVPLQPDPASVPYQDLGATLAEAAEAASRANGKSECDIPPDASSAPVPTASAGRPLDEIAKDYKAASEGGLWAAAVLADEAVKAHGDHSLVKLALLVNVPRPRLTENAKLGRFFGLTACRVEGVSPSAHLYGLRLAKRRLKPEATDAQIGDLARILLMQTPDCQTLQALIRSEKGSRVVPPSPETDAQPLAETVASEMAAAYEEAVAAVTNLRTWFASAPEEEKFSAVVAAVETVLAEARAAREMTTFRPTDDTRAA